MKKVLVYCFVLSIVLAVCGCEENKPTASQSDSQSVPSKETQQVEEAVKLADVSKPKQVKQATQAFFDAALDGNIQKVESELVAGVDVNAANPDRQSALMLAAFNGHTDLVEMLIVHGADVNTTDVTNRTALMYSSSGPFPETVQLLLEKGARVNIVDNNEGWTALMFAAAEGLTANVKLLLEHGADRTQKDIDGDTAASFAAKNGHSQVAKMIEEYSE